MPKQINTPVPGQGLVSRFSLKGRFQPVLDEVIVPVAIVPDPSEEARGRACQGTVRITTLTNAATYRCYLLNPTTSEMLMRVDVLKLVALAADTFDDFYIVQGYISAVDGLTFLPSGNFTNTVGYRDTRDKGGFAAHPAASLGGTFANPVLAPANLCFFETINLASVTSLPLVDWHHVPTWEPWGQVILEPGWGVILEIVTLLATETNTFELQLQWAEIPQVGGVRF